MTLQAASEPASGPLTIERRGALARVVLGSRDDTPATSATARARLAAAFPGVARDPDCYAIIVRHPTGRVGSAPAVPSGSLPDEARADVFERQRLAWLLECFSKPTVHVIDGAICGADAALALLGTHRIALDDYSFALPAVAQGLVPECGIVHALARLPDHVGCFLALTGREIGAADALACGFVTHCISRHDLKHIEPALAGARPVDPLLDDLHVEPGPSQLARDRAVIARCFGEPTIDGILRALDQELVDSEVGAEFAARALADLARAPRIALDVTLRHIREAGALDLRHVLMRDARILSVRIDRLKGGLDTPGGSVTDAAVERHFSAHVPFHLPTRREMQALRV